MGSHSDSMLLSQLLRQLHATAFVSTLDSTVHAATAPPGLHTVSITLNVTATGLAN
jgi:hypothetical protein